MLALKWKIFSMERTKDNGNRNRSEITRTRENYKIKIK